MADNNTALGLAVLALGGSSGGSEPSQYLKSASVSGNELTLTKKDGTTVEYEPTIPTYSEGTGIDITSNVISADTSVMATKSFVTGIFSLSGTELTITTV